jgi:Flp pilus assembly protein TadG
MRALAHSSTFRRLKPISARTRGEDGQALVEFAIIATVLMFIVIGILYFGRFLGYDLDQTHLANIGARWAAVNQDPGSGSGQTLAGYIASLAPGELGGSGSSDVGPVYVCVSLPSGSSGNQGDPIQVIVKSTYNFLPFLKISPTNLTVSQTATMRLEAPVASSNIISTAGTGTCS